ncbi:undecaprenyldiphospho-muramoylpentapeptide beta-N-acetylglucosaminyltransferase [Treponema phagedenis]|uniref:undecaprenyldiphospho-muramoylpentapeptide beta-N-acetylglucosaminyltransferase n=1 Tax=Treponema phagedenis TaxID=162 RepID=UPI000464B0E7|nr:undecaprenyldiphospho-muramoylpentapeptide beta-N-acetylglucosaminyltransferase [Treponema phagedenis]NVP24495.1 undecaprenyldiphospho-muramoylpentapeptide beta-N-acetylglucosaminyltransferase [Treponema phagedenis]QKS92738.1 undecaprenyldiphospho-muramoylpentapeptide beta-N-acetylglucosaminyltransferase [Treponema phagedenis]QLC58702.1 undecaprenyldiphospho-muramoylpentapeptide beta-N-acetylglucosaminyltransferase [Treponema phagedenis]
MSCVVFTGGGTGGHIFPGLAVAEVMIQKKGISIVWIGGGKGADRSYVESGGLPFKGIPAGKLRRYFSLQNFVDVFKVAAGFIKSLYLLATLKPAFVFSKGGFVSVPPCMAAKFLRIPVITHESDFTPGLATRLNSRSAAKIFVSYPETIQFLKKEQQGKAVYTGNPVRLDFYTAKADAGRSFLHIDTKKPLLFIQGGSLGARQINDLVFESISFLTEHFYVVHQCGAANVDQAKLIKQKIHAADSYQYFPFIREEIPKVLAAADIVLSRAGANSIWECAAAGKPMVLVPLEKGSSRGDQLDNAAFFEKKGAAFVLSGKKTTAENLIALLQDLLHNPEKLRVAHEAALHLGKQKPAEYIADLLIAELEKKI